MDVVVAVYHNTTSKCNGSKIWILRSCHSNIKFISLSQFMTCIYDHTYTGATDIFVFTVIFRVYACNLNSKSLMIIIIIIIIIIMTIINYNNRLYVKRSEGGRVYLSMWELVTKGCL